MSISILYQAESDLKAMNILKKEFYHEPVSCQVMSSGSWGSWKSLKACMYTFVSINFNSDILRDHHPHISCRKVFTIKQNQLKNCQKLLH